MAILIEKLRKYSAGKRAAQASSWGQLGRVCRLLPKRLWRRRRHSRHHPWPKCPPVPGPLRAAEHGAPGRRRECGYPGLHPAAAHPGAQREFRHQGQSVERAGAQLRVIGPQMAQGGVETGRAVELGQAGEDGLAQGGIRLRAESLAQSRGGRSGWVAKARAADQRCSAVPDCSKASWVRQSATSAAAAPGMVFLTSGIRAAGFCSWAAICGSGTIKFAPPARTSSPGMPHTMAVSSASAMVLPPLACSAAMAFAPSLPIPVISTPTNCSASISFIALRTSRSALGCQG